MKIKFFTVCALSMFITVAVMAQDYAFKVFGSKGSNTVDGSPVKVGAKLTESQNVIVGDGAYLGLANKNGKTIEITSKGTYKVKDLVAKAASSSSSLTSKYASFVISEITREEEEAAAANRTRHMNKTGSVSRDIGPVELMMATNNKIFGNSVLLRWYLKDNLLKEEDISAYKIIASDMADEVLYTQVIGKDKEQLLVDLSMPQLAKEQHIIFKVIPLDKDGNESAEALNSDGRVVMRLSAEEQKKVAAEYAAYNDKSSALNKLIEARFFEEQELLLDAMMAYEEAIKMVPNSPMFKQMYDDFLFRNILSKEARIQLASNSSNGGN